ncbi:MAG: hypothetical protein ACR2ML_11055, partial [Solirubrobacteraceae bacterium]
MYQFSRGIYRELAPEIVEIRLTDGAQRPHSAVLGACGAALERPAHDRHYFPRPARTLFNDSRIYFPIAYQRRVWNVVQRYSACAE